MMINRSLKTVFFLFLFLLACSAFAGQADVPKGFALLISEWLTTNEKALFKLRVFDGVFTLAVIVCCFLPLIVVNVRGGEVSPIEAVSLAIFITAIPLGLSFFYKINEDVFPSNVYLNYARDVTQLERLVQNGD